MTYIDTSNTIARRYYLNVAPMIAALQFQPTDFELKHGWLNHVPSRHRFSFDRAGNVTIDARCGCAQRPRQYRAKRRAFPRLYGMAPVLLGTPANRSRVCESFSRRRTLG